MSEPLLSPEFQSVLKVQGTGTDTYVGALDAGDYAPLLHAIVGESVYLQFSDVAEAVKAARSSGHFVIVCGAASASALLAEIGPDISSTVGVVVVGDPAAAGATVAGLRAAGAMSVESDATEDSLRRILRRGLEFRALRALELAHRCEAQRLYRRELELLGSPPELMTDDLETSHPPPLPVGPMSTYSLDEASEAFERAYIDRVQHLCASAREAATFLDVSAATLARRLRREGVE